MSKSLLIGKSKELFVATELARRYLHIYLPLVDNGFDFVVNNPTATSFVPVQVKYKQARTGFTLKRTDGERYAACDAVIIFCDGEALLKEAYFFPARDWRQRALQEDRSRSDGKLSVYLSSSNDWADRFRGDNGLLLAFGADLPEVPIPPIERAHPGKSGRASHVTLGSRVRSCIATSSISLGFFKICGRDARPCNASDRLGMQLDINSSS